MALSLPPGVSVVCYREDGHVALEWAGMHCARTDDHPVTDACPDEAECSLNRPLCVDIPVSIRGDASSQIRLAGNRHVAAKPASPAAAHEQTVALAPKAASPFAFSPAIPAKHLSRDVLRTVVLTV
ncbi:MAG: hypothetical protein IT440_02350 [Phycisphaeraceae bacterium]|nr:hypothetical protein [Phycisphaeraceae bacterium]